LHNEPDNTSPVQILKLISERAHDLIIEQYDTLYAILEKHLPAEDIRFVRRNSAP